MELISFICISSIILIVHGLYKLLYYNYAKKNYSIVVGHIKEFYEHFNDTAITKYPIIHYEVNGKLYKKMGWGEVIQNKPWKVFYKESNPRKCVLEN